MDIYPGTYNLKPSTQGHLTTIFADLELQCLVHWLEVLVLLLTLRLSEGADLGVIGWKGII